MTMSIFPKYRVGDSCWLARYGSRGVKKPCPICFGKKEVVLIPGNGDQVIMPCEVCGRGLREPAGFIIEPEFDGEPELVVIEEVRTRITALGCEIEYLHGGGFVVDEKYLFPDRESALALGEELKRKAERTQMESAEFMKKNARKSFIWNAAFHLKEARQLRIQAEYHEKMARLCQAKAEGRVS